MRSSEVRLLLQDFCVQETQRKGDSLVVLSLPGVVGSLLMALAEQRLRKLCGLTGSRPCPGLPRRLVAEAR